MIPVIAPDHRRPNAEPEINPAGAALNS